MSTPSPSARQSMRWWLMAMLAFSGGCDLLTPDERVSLGAPTHADGVVHPGRLTDEMRSFEGAPWDSNTTARFRHANAYVEYDLGEVVPLHAAYIQGDNNDTFIVETSEDGTTFEALWTAGPHPSVGLRGRWTVFSERKARFVRLRAEGGDRSVSASELQLFRAKPTLWPPWIEPSLETPPTSLGAFGVWIFGLFAMIALAFEGRVGRRWRLGLWGVTALCAVGTVYTASLAWPPEEPLVNATRAVAAAVGCMAVVRIGLWRPLQDRRLAMVLLGTMAALSVASFYNLGFPQFWDSEARRPTYVHGHDLRVYFPTAKYFDELGYDGVYLASVQAYSEDRLDGTLRGIEDIEVRDLRDYKMRTVQAIEPEIRAARSRFSPERWEAFKRDMAYFWETMGERGYFGSLRDHGGNATPAWLLVAHFLFGSADAENAVFWRWGLLDPLLLLLLFLVAWRTFGLRAALVSMIVFGATTFYQLGSNWGGATLRNDWMALLGFGVCALASRRHFLAGALLGWSAMIRAFPAVALVFVALWFGFAWFRAIRSPEPGAPVGPAVFWPFARLVAGVATIVVVLGVASSATFGFEESWVAWGEKIGLHVDEPNVNHVGLTALVGYKTDNLWDKLRERGQDPQLWKPLTKQTVRERWWIRAVGVLLFMTLAVIATARNRLADAAILGSMMIPIVFYPSNYYLHCLFLWPLLLARKQRDVDRDWATIAATLLALCTMQWFGWLIPGRYGQFLLWSGMLLAAMLVILVVAARHVYAPQSQRLEKV